MTMLMLTRKMPRAVLVLWPNKIIDPEVLAAAVAVIVFRKSHLWRGASHFLVQPAIAVERGPPRGFGWGGTVVNILLMHNAAVHPSPICRLRENRLECLEEVLPVLFHLPKLGAVTL